MDTTSLKTMATNTHQRVIRLLRSAISLCFIFMASSVKSHSNEINLAELKQVSATGWISDGTKGSVDLVEIEACGLKNVAQDIASLFNTTPKTKLNFIPDLSSLMSSYSLKIKLLATDKELTIRLITSELISLKNGENEVFYRLKNSFAANAFVPNLEKLLFSQKIGYWKKMKEVERMKNEF